MKLKDGRLQQQAWAGSNELKTVELLREKGNRKHGNQKKGITAKKQ
jgi:hypothetical protein